MRRSTVGSVWTHREQGATRRRRPFSWARCWKSCSSSRNSRPRSVGSGAISTALASRRETSSSMFRSWPRPSREACMRRQMSERSRAGTAGAWAMERRAVRNRPRAWMGWRRSWLAAARKTDLARSAASARSFSARRPLMSSSIRACASRRSRMSRTTAMRRCSPLRSMERPITCTGKRSPCALNISLSYEASAPDAMTRCVICRYSGATRDRATIPSSSSRFEPYRAQAAGLTSVIRPSRWNRTPSALASMNLARRSSDSRSASSASRRGVMSWFIATLPTKPPCASSSGTSVTRTHWMRWFSRMKERS
eukprot:Opistho-2@82313